ncbi:hypothetical protein CDAR_310421 [Caerostris darwini]|uniref:Uncharacterized protein n=1 Tax=Caerostris darwini TaxID=1538125 RepID=A0AAV4T1D9_9ARAC|nr:hypothetical protein CDAR_310421 [Caerostris darwini]
MLVLQNQLIVTSRTTAASVLAETRTVENLARVRTDAYNFFSSDARCITGKSQNIRHEKNFIGLVAE